MFELRITHVSLSVARICFFAVVAIEYVQLYLLRKISFLKQDELVAEVLLPLTILSFLLMAVGYRLRLLSWLTFVLVLVTQERVLDHYHADYLLQNVCFLFLLAPPSLALSVDSYRTSPTARQNGPLPLWFATLVFLSIELVYLDSLFYKFGSTLWLDGLAFWLPAALPHFSTGNLPDFMEIEWLMRGLAYLAFSLELLFPLILFKPTKRIVWLIGFALHIGISFFFPIPLFGAAVCALYLVFLDWERILERLGHAYLDHETSGPSAPNDRSHTSLGWIVVGLVILIQGVTIADRYVGPDHWISHIYQRAVLPASIPLGLREHGVYVDHHFTRRTPLLRFIAETPGGDEILPTFGELSYPVFPIISGRYWVMTMFHMRDDSKSLNTLLRSIWHRFVRGSLETKGVSVNDIYVRVYYHNVQHPLRFDFTLDNRIEHEGWEYAGRMQLRGDALVDAVWAPTFEALMVKQHP